MAVSLEQFVEQLSQTGLMSAEEVSTLCISLPEDQRPDDAQSLAKLLIRRRKLTKYQAQAIYNGKHNALVFHEYVVLDRIGAGGMGVVLKAKHRRMDRVVAIKILPAEALASPDAVERFYREVKAAARLNHPNIVTAYDASEHEGMHYLVMEFVDGEDLSAIVARHGPLPVPQAVECIIQAARGLEYAHAMGIIHRDIKPGNLLLDRDGTVKILDMGLALLGEQAVGDVTTAAQLTQSGQIMGTVDYMSPEQAQDTHRADERSDIYSLGCTLYRLLTGRPPFTGDSLTNRIVAHLQQPVPSLCEQRSDVPAELDAVFAKMLAKTPEERYQSTSEVITALEPLIEHGSQTASSSGSSGKIRAAGQASAGLAGLSTDSSSADPLATTVAGAPAKPDDTFNDQSGQRTLPAGTSAPVGRRSRRRMVVLAAALLPVLTAALLGVWWFGRDPAPDSGNGPPGAQVAGTNYALAFDGVDDYVDLPVFSGRLPPEFTLEAWVTLPETANEDSPDPERIADLRLDNAITWIAYRRKFRTFYHVLDTGLDGTETLASGDRPDVETAHLACVHRQGEALVFVNGVRSQVAPRVRPSFRHLTKKQVRLGADVDQPDKDKGLYSPFHGELDEVHISKTARYTVDFTPRRRFEPDEHTIALYHCDEGQGTKLIDASGNGHHGTIHGGAKWVPSDGPTKPNDAPAVGPRSSPGRWMPLLEDDAGFAHWSCLKGDASAVSFAQGELQLNAAEVIELNRVVRAKRFVVHAEHLKKGHEAGLWLVFDRASYNNAHFNDNTYELWAWGKGLPGGMLLRKQPPRTVGETTWGTFVYTYLDGKLTAYADGQELYAVPVEPNELTAIRLRGRGSTTRWRNVAIMELTDEQAAAIRAGRLPEYTPSNQSNVKPVRTIPLEGKFAGKFAVARGGRRAVVATYPGPVSIVYDLANGKEVARLELKKHAPMAMSPSGRFVSLVHEDGRLLVWEVDGDDPPRTLTTKYVFDSQHAFTPDSSKLLVRGDETTLPLFDVATGKKDGRLTEVPTQSLRVAFTSDSRRVYVPETGGQGRLWAWDLTTLKPVELPRRVPGGFTCAVSPDGRRLALPGVQQYAIDRGFEPVGKPLAFDNAHQLAFGRDEAGRLVLMAAGRGRCALFDAETGAVRLKLEHPYGRIGLVDDDGTGHARVVTVDADRGIEIWAIPPRPGDAVPPDGNASTRLSPGTKPGQEWSDNSLGMKFCWCPPGSFKMGGGKRQVNVTVRQGFWLGKYEVTQEEYRRLMGKNSSSFAVGGKDEDKIVDVNTSRLPVEMVSWEEAMHFCRMLTRQERKTGRLSAGWEYTLPTEAQWEYACRAGSTTTLRYGEADLMLGKYAWYLDNAEQRTREVGKKVANRWGLFDTLGNVREWCRDEVEPQDPPDPKVTKRSSARVLRGGSWIIPDHECQVTSRWRGPPDYRARDTGLRVALVRVHHREEPSKPRAASRPNLSVGAKPGQEWSGNELGMKFCWCPPGNFKMGEGAEAVDVTLTRGFWLGKTEITQAQWKGVMRTQPKEWGTRPDTKAGDDYPATWVSWDDATKFCEELTKQERAAGRLPPGWEYRLPTEAQWEYTCRAGTQKAYSFGDDVKQLGNFAWFVDNANDAGQGYAHPVAEKEANPWGLHDMHGNVWEWCRDWYEAKLPGGRDPEVTQQASLRVFRGACWHAAAVYCRSSYRRGFDPGDRLGDMGFRVAAVQVRPLRPGDRAGQQWDGNGLKMTFCWCPPGDFKMGEKDKGQVDVTLTRGFWLGKTEVTQAQWKTVMNIQPWSGKENVQEGDDYPAMYVSWDDATRYCQELTKRERTDGRLPPDWEYRLPTEAQWEYACRAGTQTAYSFGEDEGRLSDYGWYAVNTREEYAHPVAQRKPNPWGLQDVHGNVYEWCRDALPNNAPLPGGVDPEQKAKLAKIRVIRGGSWKNNSEFCRSASRSGDEFGARTSNIGFRVAVVQQ